MNLDRNLSFKGERNYLHSTTLFDDITETIAGDLSNIDFTFNKKSDRQVRYQSMPPADRSKLVALWRNDAQTVFIVEREEAISLRVPYDEERLVQRFLFDGASVNVPADLGEFSAIEAVVAAFKELLHRDVVVHKPKVAFARIRLHSKPVLPLKLCYVRRIGEFYEGKILSNDDPVGRIFFGEWR